MSRWSAPRSGRFTATYTPGSHFTGSTGNVMKELKKTDFYLVVVLVAVAVVVIVAAVVVVGVVVVIVVVVVVVNQLMACTEFSLLDTKWLILSALNSKEE